MSGAARRVILTYGRFDLFDQDHADFLRRLSRLGNTLIVGCATDDSAQAQGRACHLPFEARREMLAYCRYVDRVVPFFHPDQAFTDVVNYDVSALVMGVEDAGLYDHLKDVTEVQYIPRHRASEQAIGWMPEQRRATG